MFFVPALCFVGGLVLMGRTKPKTRTHKIVALGPRSGIVWNVEDLREVGVVVVRDPSGERAVAVFVRANVHERGKPGLVWKHGFGDPTLLEAIKADFGSEPMKPRAVNPEPRAQSPEPKEEGAR